MVGTLVALLAILSGDPSNPISLRPEQKASPTPAVAYEASIDVPLTILAAGLAIGLNTGQAELDPKRSPVLRCRWCDRDATGSSALNALDRWAAGARPDPLDPRKGEKEKRSARISNAAFALAGLAAITPHMRDASRRERWAETGLVVQSLATSLAVWGVTKVSVRRARPFTHDGALGRKAVSDDNWSFFSGHTTAAFTAVAASRELARIRGDGKAKRIWTYAGGLAAAGSGYFRIAAGKHYLTDVLVGAGVGAFVGTAIPRIHVRGDLDVSAHVAPASAGIVVSW